MGCSDSKVREPLVGPPQWTRSMTFDNNLAIGFNCISDGMENISPYHVKVTRIGCHTSDLARWGAPINSGKHVFEVIWPIKKNRGTNSCIGVGTKDVPLSKNGRLSLVGIISRGWCLDLSRRRVIHTDQVVNAVYRQIPDRFWMYCDMDAGKIGFSEDLMQDGHNTYFYDYCITGVKSDDDLFVMVSSATHKENMQVIYRGSHIPVGGYDLVESLMQSQGQGGDMHHKH